jgi:multidrug efflux pump subunit AcrB
LLAVSVAIALAQIGEFSFIVGNLGVQLGVLPAYAVQPLVVAAIISITLVPALIPTFIKGHLRSEEENWIVRSFINIYKPLLTWALPRRNLVMWMFAVLLILAAGMFPLQALVGRGASESAWRGILGVFAAVTALTVLFLAVSVGGCCRS